MAPKNTLNPTTEHFEWMGPAGAGVMVLSLPLVVFGINLACGASSCDALSLIDTVPATAKAVVAAWPLVPKALAIELAWILAHHLFWYVPIGPADYGLPLRNGGKLWYRFNAIHAMVLSYASLGYAHYAGYLNLAVLADLFVPLMIAAVLISVALAVAVYLGSYRSPSTLLALGGNSGNVLYDFWVGRELNPRVFGCDIKFVCELRPGLIGWTLLNWAFVLKAHQSGTLCDSLLAVAIMQTWYVLDGLYFEPGNTSMMDIAHDGFGYMLAFGDLAWVPFLYTLQCRYLYLHPAQHKPLYFWAMCALCVVGYSVFRGANSQKDRFRKDPKDPRVAHLKVMVTSAGKNLIVSGWWGVCRHPNYVGDWLMTVAQSGLCGCTHALPWFQPIYFAVLLIHRQLRDEDMMLLKYGPKDWAEYCRRVPARLIPGLY